MEGLKNPLHCPTCPTDRRKSRAKLLKARRLSMHTAHQTVSAVGHISKDGTATECNTFGSSGDDKKANRKLRNRASALASRNKRSEEIESLTYRLERMTEETRRLQMRLSRYEDVDNDTIKDERLQVRRKRAHCFITEPAVF